MGAFSFFFKGFSGPGSSFMWLLLLICFIAVAIAVWRAMVIAKCSMGRGIFLKDIASTIKTGDMTRASAVASASQYPIAKVFAAILQRSAKGEKAMNRAADEVFLTEAPRLQRVTPLMITVANIATLTGLLGTIYGLILAFDAVANVAAAQRAQALATGIAVAMNTTFFGLVIAIPSLFIHGAISSQTDKLIEEMDEKAAKLVNILVEG